MEVEHIGQRGRWIRSPEVADMAGISFLCHRVDTWFVLWLWLEFRFG